MNEIPEQTMEETENGRNIKSENNFTIRLRTS